MGREVRRVPPNWEHPKGPNPYTGKERYKPQLETPFKDAVKEWEDGFVKWIEGDKGEYWDDETCDPNTTYWEWAGEPPNRDHYVDYGDTDPTWYQFYETVSEGTPLTPPFETKAELVDYLVKHGTFWGCRPWPRNKAEAMVEAGWTMSGMIAGQTFVSGEDIPLFTKENRK